MTTDPFDLARFVKARRWTGTVPTDEALPLDATVA